MNLEHFAEHLYSLLQDLPETPVLNTHLNKNLTHCSKISESHSQLINADIQQAKIALLIGFSGGLDSTVLLHLCSQLALNALNLNVNLSVRAIYIHHGLSENADSWQAHCQAICEAWNIKLICQRVHIDPQLGGIEAAARKARYQAFQSELLPNEYLLTAQHLDDQAETFLLAAKRGSGPAGLASMPAIKRLNGRNFQIRPMLRYSRQMLEEYATEHNLVWIEDESNQNNQFDRNFLRNQILPELHKRWAHFNRALSQSAAYCAEQEELIDELLTDALRDTIDPADQTLLIDVLKTASDAKRNAIIRRWFQQHQLPHPSREQLRVIWQEVALSRMDSSAKLELKVDGVMVSVRRFQNKLYLLLAEQMNILNEVHDKIVWQDLSKNQVLPIIGEISWQEITEQLIKANQPLNNYLKNSVEIRFGLNNKTRLNIVGRSGSRELKKIWQEKSIPPWMRPSIPLLYINNELVMAIGVFVVNLDQSL